MGVAKSPRSTARNASRIAGVFTIRCFCMYSTSSSLLRGTFMLAAVGLLQRLSSARKEQTKNLRCRWAAAELIPLSLLFLLRSRLASLPFGLLGWGRAFLEQNYSLHFAATTVAPRSPFFFFPWLPTAVARGVSCTWCCLR